MSWFEPITHEAAEALEGKKLDRRRKYYAKTEEGLTATRGGNANGWGFPGNEGAFVLQHWSESCSGCEGCGCFECGNTGNRRQSMHFPLDEFKIAQNNVQKPLTESEEKVI